MQPATFKSDFAILDVKRGRRALEKRLAKPGLQAAGKPIHVRVDMLINYPHGRDDGTSMEFSCTVLAVKEFGR